MPLRHMQLHTTQILTDLRAVPRYGCPVPGQARNGWGDPSSRSDGTRAGVGDFQGAPSTGRATRHRPGIFRYVVERTIAWPHGFRRLRIRWERRDDIHEAFLGLAISLITHRPPHRLFLDL